MSVKVAALLLFPLLELSAADEPWWAYQVQNNVVSPSCAVFSADFDLFQALVRAGVSRSTAMQSFPKISWSDFRAGLAVLPMRKFGLPEDALVEKRDDINWLRFLPSQDEKGGAMVVQIPRSAQTCKVAIASGPEVAATFPTGRLFIVGGGKNDGGNKTWKDISSPVKSVDINSLARMGPLRSGVAYLPVAGEYSRRTTSAADCSNVCASDAQCKAVTFIASQKLCWVKSAVPGTAPSSDMVSAVKQTP